ncbi:hypothetical protein BH11MYX4_BH11MYX4_48060 [soil metagenome]
MKSSPASRGWVASAALAVALPLTVLTSLLAGCSRDDAPAERDRAASGEAIYASMCKGCHGARGEGGRGPNLRDMDRKYDEPALARYIDAKMPLGEPERCDGTCPEDVGAYVFRTFRGAIVCDAPVPAARGLRVLTNREYRATVEDLLGSAAAAPGAPPPLCGQQAFTYDPKGRVLTSVHVAGSFNGWSSTVAGGGWPLAKQPGGTWSVTHAVPNGSNQYKLVLNESEWVLDAANPKTASNGLGGENSLLDVSCEAGGTPAPGTPSTTLDPTASFPPDTRPEGFAFEDHGPGRIVTSVLMDEWARAAANLAAAADLAKIVTCDRAARDACAKSTVQQLGKRAFRRPLTDAELTRHTGVLLGAGDFDKGVRSALRAMLMSPSFAYRSETGERQPDGTYRLTPWETASALSYFFWGTMPDAALFDAAERGDLGNPAGIEREARRLLASPRARAMVATFAEQWLGGEGVLQVTKSEQAYPFPADVRAAMREETRRFVTHVVFDGSHSLDELLTANYTFANETLAKHYGLPGVVGSDLRQVPYGDPARAGVLGEGSILATTAHSDQTSPIRRGLFVRRRLLCQEFAPPPPNAGSAPRVDAAATTRDRFAQHTANAFCKSCHQYIDGVGFGFERLDAVGRLRDAEAGKPIDSSGDMNDVEGFGKGTHAPFANLTELGHILASSDAAKSCVVRQVYRFARGRLDDDICETAGIKQRLGERGGDLRELLIGVATDPAFVVRK